MTADAGSTFMFNGLDDGTYTLSETAPPANYTAAADIAFTITSTKTQTEGSEALASLEVNNEAFTVGKAYKITHNEETNTNTLEETASGAEKGSVLTTVKNYKGTNLPQTGGMGTKAFVAGGGLTALLAGVWLATKKRMGKED